MDLVRTLEIFTLHIKMVNVAAIRSVPDLNPALGGGSGGGFLSEKTQSGTMNLSSDPVSLFVCGELLQ